VICQIARDAIGILEFLKLKLASGRDLPKKGEQSKELITNGARRKN